MAIDSKRALLGATIDYAGTFPPAQLPLEKALARAASYRSDGQAPWLMHRVALPWRIVFQLGGSHLFEAGAKGEPWSFALIGANERGEVSAELDQLSSWISAARGSVPPMRAASYETSCLMEEGAVGDLIQEAEVVFRGTDALLYLEVGLDEKKIEEVARVGSESALSVGLKVRTGGKVVPTPEQLARVIAIGREYRVPFKATQGLHDAMSHGRSFGFVNLFAALNFAYSSDTFDQTSDCLKEEDAKAFSFEKDGFRWRDQFLPLTEIFIARGIHQGSFGSCSIDEPDESLAKTFPES